MSNLKISLSQSRYILANINIILLLVGYTLFTALFFGVTGNLDLEKTRGLSILYRAFALLIALLTILLNLKKPFLKNQNIKLYFFLWFLFSIRIIYDLFIRSSEVSPANTIYFFQFIFGGILLPTIAVFMSYRNLNLKLIYYSVFFILILVVFKGVIINIVLTSVGLGRAQMNLAQSTLTFGSFGGILALLSYSLLVAKKGMLKVKFLAFSTFCLGMLAVGIAGSRGPLFGVFFTILITFFSKNILTSIKFSFLIIIIGIVFGEVLLDLIESNLPIFYDRIYNTIVNSSLGGRESVFEQAIDQIFSNPLLGDWFLLDRSDTSSIAHNAFLQAAMCLGILGGILNVYIYYVLFQKSIKIIQTSTIYSFWGYATLFYMIYSLTTGGSIYIKSDFNFAFLILLLISSKTTNLYLEVFKNASITDAKNRFKN
tara:strand:- start:4902 stop:6185 length:1284 start_codon:yes stop_codon:yes gene_type:complete